MNQSDRTVKVRVLLVEDDEAQRQAMAALIAANGFEVMTANDGDDAIRVLSEWTPDVIVTDLMMPRTDGFDLLRHLEQTGDRTPTIVLTAFGSVDKAISVVHELGAFWFIEKPVEAMVLRTLIERARTQKHLIDETQVLNRQLSHQGVLSDLIGSTAKMRYIYSMIQQVAPTTASVLITGESGTGKELVARAIHRLSPRADRPFIAVNCAAIPETMIESELFGHEKGAFTGAIARHAGCFEQAQGGTVLLDEIGDMPVSVQAKLLRVLEEGTVRRLGGKCDVPVNVRIIAATNKPPEEGVRNKQFREDLYYRLNVFRLAIPPLRERKEDIPAICEAIISNLNAKNGSRITAIHPDVVRELQAHDWPGNVRELRNVLERAAIMAGEGSILPKHVPRLLAGSATAAAASNLKADASFEIKVGPTIREVERSYIKLVMEHTKQNRTQAAKILGIGLRTLVSRLRELRDQAGTAAA